MNKKEPDPIARMLKYKSVGVCDNCGHAVGYYDNSKELIHYLDLFPDDQLAEDISKTHCSKPSCKVEFEEDTRQLEQLFEEIKALATLREKAVNKFCKMFEDLYDYEAPTVLESNYGIDWQDVLVWGIEDASFADFLRDVKIYIATVEKIKSEGF